MKLLNKIHELLGNWVMISGEKDIAVESLSTTNEMPSSSVIIEKRQPSLEMISPKLFKPP